MEQKENKIMKENYYALLIAIFCNESAKQALTDMWIAPSEEEEEL